MNDIPDMHDDTPYINDDVTYMYEYHEYVCLPHSMGWSCLVFMYGYQRRRISLPYLLRNDIKAGPLLGPNIGPNI